MNVQPARRPVAVDVPVVLVIEDDLDTRLTVQKMLMQHGYVVHTARDRDEALFIMKQTPVDIILLDYWMGGMTASVFMTRVKNHFSNVRIILMTAQDKARSVMRILGINEVLPKPFDDRQLVSVISGSGTSTLPPFSLSPPGGWNFF